MTSTLLDPAPAPAPAPARGARAGRPDAVHPQPLLPPLRLGPHVIETPVVLAPMAGITNAPFRALCRRYGAGAFVSEMVTSRALLERSERSLSLVAHEAGASPRSVQLYGVDPATVGAAVAMLVEEDRADHVDLNFGCPVAKVTRRGGGSALPWKTDLFAAVVRAAVRAAAPAGVPVTVKMRTGIDEDHLTFLDAGRAARDEGVAAIALHGRTAAQYYSGRADWTAIAALKAAVDDVPVLGNGDLFCAEDALDMVAATGCDGVVVGRGCLGRPWLFADLAAAFAGSHARVRPGLGEVADTLARHAALLVEHHGDEQRGCRDVRKHVAWYLKGYAVGGEVRAALGLVDSLAELDALLAGLDRDQPYPGAAAEGSRGRTSSTPRVHLPAGWLADRATPAPGTEAGDMLAAAELDVSGG